MKTVILATLTCLSLCLPVAAQTNFTASLTGNPINTTGWTVSPVSYVSTNTMVLTNPQTNQAGYVYYNQPVNLTSCAQFTVSFEFQVTSSSNPPADGLAFWYISNPPTGFILGGGIGLPNNPNGLVLILDTYDNNSTPDNPLVTLRGFNGTQNYTEGSAVGLLGTQVNNQTFITNSSWHSCTLTYNNGNLTVAFNGAAPVITASYPLNQTGYFGFSASTGALWSKHSIRNVTISGYIPPDAPIVSSPLTYCQYASAVPLTATGNNLLWYTTATGGTASTTPPIPNTATPGSTTWYVAQAGTLGGCEGPRAPIVVNVNAKPPVPSVQYKAAYCPGEAFVPFSVTGQSIRWYTQPNGGNSLAGAPTVNTNNPGTYTWYVSQTVLGCESDRTPVQVRVYDKVTAGFGYQVRYGCEADTVSFTSSATGALYHQWDFGNGNGDTIPNPTHIYVNQGVYTVKQRTLNAHCIDSSVQQLDLNHPLQAGFAVSADSICQMQQVQFTDGSTATSRNGIAPTWFWDFGDGNTSTQQHPAHVFTRSGVYRVMQVVRDFVPCTDTAWHTVVVDSMPFVRLTVSDTVLCQGQGVQLRAEYLPIGFRGLSWELGQGLSQNHINPLWHSFDEAGNQSILLTAHYRVCPDVSLTQQIQVKPHPVLWLGPDTAICPGGNPILISDYNQSSPGAYEWNTGAAGPQLLVEQPGLYWLRKSLDGCTASDSVAVRKDCYINIPNSFTPNGDGLNDYFLPRDLLSRSLTSFKMSVFNRWGQLIWESSSTTGRGWDGMFNGEPQLQGVYIYLIDVTFQNGHKEKFQGNVSLLR